MEDLVAFCGLWKHFLAHRLLINQCTCLLILQISFQSHIPLSSQGYTSRLLSYGDCMKKREFQDLWEEYVYNALTLNRKPWRYAELFHSRLASWFQALSTCRYGDCLDNAAALSDSVQRLQWHMIWLNEYNCMHF